jgi:hypothetical protein
MAIGYRNSLMFSWNGCCGYSLINIAQVYPELLFKIKQE